MSVMTSFTPECTKGRRRTLEDPEVPDIGVTNFRHLGGAGECRHDFHCIGSESCVNFRGNFM